MFDINNEIYKVDVLNKIKMIQCPLCGKGICSRIGFNCRTECLNSLHTHNDYKCIQTTNNCKCLVREIKNYFIDKYSFDKKMNTKDMVINIANNLINYLPDDLFEI